MQVHQLAETALQSGARVASFEEAGRKCWVKRQQERGVLLRLQKGSAKHLFSNEIENMVAFTEAGIHAPKLLASTSEYFVSEDIGPSLETILQTDMSERKSLVVEAAKAIADLHNRGLAHGGLHLRNICKDIKNQGRIGFIDLESASRKSAPIEAQAYDLAVFFWSNFYIDLDVSEEMERARVAYRKTSLHDVWTEAKKWAEKHEWMRYASKPLIWHEKKFRTHKIYKRYAAVPLALDFLRS